MIAQKQYKRMLANIGDPTQPLLAHARVAQQAPDIPDMDPFFGAWGAAWDAPMSIRERLKAGGVVFDSMRKSCPNVYLREDGSDALEGGEIRWVPGFGTVFNTLDLVLTHFNKMCPHLRM